MAPNQRQHEAWNGGESVHYVAHADRYDGQLAPFTEALLDQVRSTPGGSVLDVGCGAASSPWPWRTWPPRWSASTSRSR
ncbi:MAG: hypothetical protein ACRDY1_04290 [Acidimicrobiales bacterium]